MNLASNQYILPSNCAHRFIIILEHDLRPQASNSMVQYIFPIPKPHRTTEKSRGKKRVFKKIPRGDGRGRTRGELDRVCPQLNHEGRRLPLRSTLPQEIRFTTFRYEFKKPSGQFLGLIVMGH
jgi:hypothetical protein